MKILQYIVYKIVHPSPPRKSVLFGTVFLFKNLCL